MTASRQDPPHRAVAHVPVAASTRNAADMVENQPTPIFSTTGKQAADPAAAKKYRMR